MGAPHRGRWSACTSAIVALGGALLPDVDGVVVAIATAAVALLFMPVRGERCSDTSTRWCVATARRRRRAFDGVGRRLGSASDDDELLVAMSESVMHALRLGGLAIDVDWPSGARRLASVGDINRDSIESRPLVVGGSVVGRLVVSGRRGELLDRSTSESLDDLAPVVGRRRAARRPKPGAERVAGADRRRPRRGAAHDATRVARRPRPGARRCRARPAGGHQSAADGVPRRGRSSSTGWPARSTNWSRWCEHSPTASSHRSSTNSVSSRRSSTSPIVTGSAAASIWS